MREITDFKWDNNIRKIYYYDGARIALPFNCYFVDPEKQDYFEVNVWNLDGSKLIFTKTFKFNPINIKWYNYMLSENAVNEIGIEIKNYIDKLTKYI